VIKNVPESVTNLAQTRRIFDYRVLAIGGVAAALIQEPEALLPSAFPGAAGRGSSGTTVQMCSRWWLRSRDAWGALDG